MGKRPRSLTDADRADWATYAARIAALPGRTPAIPPEPHNPTEPHKPTKHRIPAEANAAGKPPAAAPTSPPQPPSQRAVTQAAHRSLAVGDAPGGLDAATWQRFRAGKIPPGRELDLHGLTVQRAFRALVTFLHSAHADRLRCVEVVTGRGRGDTPSVLRRELPLWLNLPEIRPMVLAAAHPHAANPGAVRLLLRRAR